MQSIHIYLNTMIKPFTFYNDISNYIIFKIEFMNSLSTGTRIREAQSLYRLRWIWFASTEAPWRAATDEQDTQQNFSKCGPSYQRLGTHVSTYMNTHTRVFYSCHLSLSSTFGSFHFKDFYIHKALGPICIFYSYFLGTYEPNDQPEWEVLIFF